MKQFPPEIADYEKVYTSKRYLQKYKPEKIQKPDGFKSLEEYQDRIRDFLREKSISMWDDFVQTHWLFNKFKYVGEHWTHKITSNGIQSNIAFKLFVHEMVGSSHMFTKSSHYYCRINSYFDELFPKFDSGDPFKNPELYAFPFKHVNLDYMQLVHQMAERMDILNHAEERKMKYNEFVDFVIDYVGKCNETSKKDIYGVSKSWNMSMCVINLRKK